MKTYTPRAADIKQEWHLIDADGVVLGRLATEVATLLRGKHKPIFAPHIDTGDHVVVVNAAKIRVTADKESKKVYYRHSGYPGGLKERSLAEVMERDPTQAVISAVRGMLPKNRLARQAIKKLHVYSGAEHQNGSQNPQPYQLDPRAGGTRQEEA